MLFAGSGRDVLIGGSGADRFVYTNAAHIGTGDDRDVIRDFKPGTDLLDLARIDANTQLPGNQAFSFIGAAAFTQAGQLRYEDGMLATISTPLR